MRISQPGTYSSQTKALITPAVLTWLTAIVPAQELGFEEVLRLSIAEGDSEVWISPDGTRMAADGHPLFRVRSIAFSRDGRHLAVAMPDTNAFIDLASGKVVYARSPDGDKGAFALASGMTGPEVILADQTGIGLWNISEGTRIQRFTTESRDEWKSNAALSPDGYTLVLGDGLGGQGAAVVNLLTGVSRDEEWDVNDLAWSGDGQLVTVSGNPSSCIVGTGYRPPPRLVRVHDPSGKIRVETPLSFPGLMSSSEPDTAAFVPGEQAVLVGSLKGMVKVDTDSGAITEVNTENCQWLRFLDDNWFVTRDFRTLTLQHYPSFAPLDSFSLSDFIHLLQLSPDRELLAFVSADYLVVLAITVG